MIAFLKRLFTRTCDHDWMEDGTMEHDGYAIFTWVCTRCGDLLLSGGGGE